MIDKGISYDIPQLAKPKGDGRKRQGYRGDDAYGGGTTAGGDRSNSPGDRGDGPASGGGAPGPGDTGGSGGYEKDFTDQFGAKGSSPTSTGPDRTKVGPGSQYDINKKALADLKKITYQDVQKKIPSYIPYAGYINAGLNILGEVGFEKNLDFFAENVAGKHGYGYSYEDFEQYMDDRQSGKVGAYGNKEQGENALRGIGGGGGGDDRQNVSGILENLLQPGIFPGEEPQSIPKAFNYLPYSNQVVVAPGSQGLASLTGGQGFLSNII